jgi:hypothetical protein
MGNYLPQWSTRWAVAGDNIRRIESTDVKSAKYADN